MSGPALRVTRPLRAARRAGLLIALAWFPHYRILRPFTPARLILNAEVRD